jgi:hypothetical protein
MGPGEMELHVYDHFAVDRLIQTVLRDHPGTAVRRA